MFHEAKLADPALKFFAERITFDTVYLESVLLTKQLNWTTSGAQLEATVQDTVTTADRKRLVSIKWRRLSHHIEGHVYQKKKLSEEKMEERVMVMGR